MHFSGSEQHDYGANDAFEATSAVHSCQRHDERNLIQQTSSAAQVTPTCCANTINQVVSLEFWVVSYLPSVDDVARRHLIPATNNWGVYAI